MGHHSLVIVESPAKAKTINKYLGEDYTVLASFGHIRDLPSKDGSVLPDDEFAMQWELADRANKTLSDIKKALKDSDTVILATDPDREGEAIAWHLLEYFNEKNLIKDKDVKRVTFNAVTKNAIIDAFNRPRELDQDLVDAYLARRALDYLVGFNISPVLWRKLPGAKSAGRVQSVALRLIAEREDEIEKFKADEYWTIAAVMHTPDGAPFEARLTHLSGNKLDKLDIGTEADAKAAVKRIEAKALSVQKVERKQTKRNPYAPFITSTLQQEASRKLGFGAQQTMRTAQKLYEAGLITYMRTDGITLGGEAIAQIRKQIQGEFGGDYLPDSPRAYKSKAKNAQEAHEAIRPTDMTKTPQRVKLDDAEWKLYNLIWKRTMACQMESAVLDQVAVDISDGTDDVVLRANGSVVKFDGFLKLYRETDDDGKSDNDNDRILPNMTEGDALKTRNVDAEQHFTAPPPRYTEASLVKKLEEEGIGRPSTYASIIQVLQDRNYVRLEQKRFIPEDRGRIVTTFLMRYFTRYVDYKFTAELEEELDAISGGHVAYKEALRLFWKDFSKTVEDIKPLTITEVIDALNAELEDHFFPKTKDNPDPRKCPSCADGRLSLKLGKFGAFIGCTNYPDCNHTRRLEVQDGEEGDMDLGGEGHELGIHPDTDMPIIMKKGPYGVYVEMASSDPDKKPKRQSLPKGVSPTDMTLERAIDLLRLPREVGAHPETGLMIEANVGRFGPYLQYDGDFISLKKDDNVLTVGMNRAVALIAEYKERKAAEKIRDIGEHPKKGEMMILGKNRFGLYVQMGKKKAKLPKSTKEDKVDVDLAVEALGAKTKGKAKKKPATKKK
jgi:DNA topoisomerase-1